MGAPGSMKWVASSGYDLTPGSLPTAAAEPCSPRVFDEETRDLLRSLRWHAGCNDLRTYLATCCFGHTGLGAVGGMGDRGGVGGGGRLVAGPGPVCRPI